MKNQNDRACCGEELTMKLPKHIDFASWWSLHTILESLPISSSGHMRLFRKYLQKYKKINVPEEPEYLTYFMHITTALIILFFLLIRVLPEFTNITHFEDRIALGFAITSIAIAIFVANTVTLVFYFLFKKISIRDFPLVFGFIITALLLLSLYYTPDTVRYALNTLTEAKIIPIAAIVGCAQGLALLPGISRLAATFVTARWCGIDPATGFIFALLIQLPLIGAALVKSLYEILYKKFPVPHIAWHGLLRVFFATIFSYGLLELVFYAAQHDQIVWFGWYMFIPALIGYYWSL